MQRLLALLFLDTILLGAGYYLSFLIHSEAFNLGEHRSLFVLTLPLAVGTGLAGLFLAGVLPGSSRAAKAAEYMNIARGSFYAVGLLMAVVILLGKVDEFPRSIFFIYLALMPAAAALTRLSWRAGERLFPDEHASGGRRRALVVGAGKTTFEMIEGARRGGEGSFDAVHIVDDRDAVQGNTMHGVKIRGRIGDIPLQAWKSRASELVVASEIDTGELLPIAREGFRAGLPLRVLPWKGDMDGSVPLHRQLRPLRLTDLLDRGGADISPGEIRGRIAGKTVLILGADSTIGRGLCRQAGQFNPAKLLLMGSSAEMLDVIDRETGRRFPGLARKILLGSPASQCRMEEVMAEFTPEVVFFIAPCRDGAIARDNYRDALMANAVAVRRSAEAAAAARVSLFLHVSSDEAGEPVNVAGLSLRMGELVLPALGGGDLETAFSSVRVGEVLDEEAGLAALWLEQAERGGPVTLSHEEAERYYISSDRAARLVLQAAALARGGEIFAVGPGILMKSASVVRLAAVMAGHDQGRELEIRYTGLARGERLRPGGGGATAFDETGREGVQVARPGAADGDFLAVLSDLEDLISVCDSPREIFALARRLVPEYRPPGRKHL